MGYALDLVSWKIIQKSLPSLAAQIVANDQAPKGQEGLYQAMSSLEWWQKNITPSYAMSKADAKDLAGVSKDLDAASTTILSLSITTGGSTKASSMENARSAAQFLRTGGAYLQLYSLINHWENVTVNFAADIQRQMTSAEMNLVYEQIRVKNLEDLHKRFPGSANQGQQVVDAKDSGAKYLPLTTQIIAANSDINKSKEQLLRLGNRLDQIEIVNSFLGEAKPLLEGTTDGLLLVSQFMRIERALKSNVSKGTFHQKEVLDQLHFQLSEIKSRFTTGLEANTAPTSKKTGMMKATASSSAAAFFLMLLALLGKQV